LIVFIGYSKSITYIIFYFNIVSNSILCQIVSYESING